MSLHSGGRGLGHVSRSGGAGSTAGIPINSVLPKFVDGLGNTITAPIVGMGLFLDPGAFSNSPASYSYRIYDTNGYIGESGSWNAGSPAPRYIVQDAELGLALQVGIIAFNGISSAEALSTATSSVVDIVL